MPKKESPLFKLIEPKAFEKAEKLLKEGRVAVDAENADGLTALHVAIQKGNAQLIQLLLSKGAAHKLKNGKTLAHTAAEAGQFTMLQWLEKRRFKFNMKDSQGHSPLDSAVSRLVNLKDELEFKKSELNSVDCSQFRDKYVVTFESDNSDNKDPKSPKRLKLFYFGLESVVTRLQPTRQCIGFELQQGTKQNSLRSAWQYPSSA